jgi:hypothetical protein
VLTLPGSTFGSGSVSSAKHARRCAELVGQIPERALRRPRLRSPFDPRDKIFLVFFIAYILPLFHFSRDHLRRKGRGFVVTVADHDQIHPRSTQAMSSSGLPRVNAGIPSPDCALQLADGSVFSGISFGAEDKSVAGECVFQTGKHIAQCDLGFRPGFTPSMDL